jgi:hypothetical protein
MRMCMDKRRIDMDENGIGEGILLFLFVIILIMLFSASGI